MHAIDLEIRNPSQEILKTERTLTDHKISNNMQSIISHCTQFNAKPIGPIHACVNSQRIKDSLPLSFMNVYIVDNNTDSDTLQKLCEQHNEPIPDRIVYPFSEKHYADLEKDPKADIGIIESLKAENPIIANVLVDHLNIHVMGMHSCKHFNLLCS